MTLQHPVVEALGWIATATFVGSYFLKRAEAMVRVQIAGAAMWVAYGLFVRSGPVVAANALVVASALWKARAPTVPGAERARSIR